MSARDKAYAAQAGDAQVEALLNYWRRDMAPSLPPMTPAGVAIDETAIRASRSALAHAAPPWALAERRRARTIADKQAAELVAREHADANAAREGQQRLIDWAWHQVQAGENTHIEFALQRSFNQDDYATLLAHREGTAWAAVGVESPEELIPERISTVTSTGRAGSRKRSVGDRNELYAKALMSLTLGAARRALSVPGIRRCLAGALREADEGFLVLACVDLRRDVPFTARHASGAFADANGELRTAGRTNEVQPLDSSEPPVSEFIVPLTHAEWERT